MAREWAIRVVTLVATIGLIYGYLAVETWVASPSTVEAIRYSLTAGMTALAAALFLFLRHYFRESQASINAEAQLAMVIQQYINEAVYDVFRYTLNDDDRMSVEVTIHGPNCLCNCMLVIGKKRYEVEPFYFFRDQWRDNFEAVRDQYAMEA